MTIPIGDEAFREIAHRLLEDRDSASAATLQARLRTVFPRAVVRARELTGEAPAWYVYRDGGWHSNLEGEWWEAPDLPRLALTLDGWISEGNATALGILGMDASELGSRHFTDFIAPGTLDDSLAIFGIVQEGRDLTATVLMRPASGYVIAIDMHGWRDGDVIRSVMRLADDVETGPPPTRPDPPRLRCTPETDVAFREYAERSLARVFDPTPEGLAMRLRRLYPRADVSVEDDHWLAAREPGTDADAGSAWWAEPSVARVRYDAQALIIEANAEAVQLLGRDLVGRYWQELVIPGSAEQVSAMLAILADVGRAESRFRMPRADGSLVEFDSFTEVDGETYVTVMRPSA